MRFTVCSALLVLSAGISLRAAEGAGDADFEAWKKTIKLPAARIRCVEKAPEIDGVMDEVYTKSAEAMKFTFNDGFSGEVANPTTARIVSDKENLYLFVECSTPDPQKLVAKATAHDGDVWADEAVEIFLDPKNSRDFKYFHIMANSAGVTADARKTDANTADSAWDPALTVKCAKTKTSWTLEMKIPFKDLDQPSGAVNNVWALNLTRSAHDLDDPDMAEDLAWSPTRARTSHKPSMFGYLWLDAGTKLNK